MRRLSTRARLLLLAGLTAATAASAVAPRPLSSPIRRLADYRADPPGPIFNVRHFDAEALVRAARYIPKDGVYALVDGAPPSPSNPQTVLHHDLLGASYLYLLPAVPALSLRGAGWAIVYDEPLPNAQVVARYPLGPGITLLKLGHD